MIKIIKAKNLKLPERDLLTSKPDIYKSVSDIIQKVILEGDKALYYYTEKFDNIKLEKIQVSQKQIKDSVDKINAEDRKVIEASIKNIRYFHEKQKQKSWKEVYEDKSELGQIVTPVQRAGIYIPGGRAVYPSSLIMNAVPAQIAGVPFITVVSPPQKDGLPNYMVLGTCFLLGLEHVYSVGGAHSIAALAHGTESIKPVYKITGPGNAWVAEAKRQVFGKVGIDSIAGPSEILILNDDPDVPVDYIVRDMLSQAEHDPDAQSILITTIDKMAENVRDRLEEIIPELPRNTIIKQSIDNKGMIIIVDDIQQGVDLVNEIAPEHLEILVKDESIISKIHNAGAMFVGKWSSEPVGDYFAGPNHILPTNGAAKYASPLMVSDFLKHTSYIKYTKERLINQGKMIAHFAEMEELYAHAQAIKTRLEI